MSRDYICVLTVRVPHGAVMTKRLFRKADGSIGKTGYDHPYLFDVQMIALDGLADLGDVLFTSAARRDCCVIRGMPISGHRNVLRRLHVTFAPDRAGHHWLMVDFDKIPLPLFLEPDDASELLIGFLIRLLPPEFHDASCLWQWSCGHGIDPRYLRAHLWFWSSDKHTDTAFENWAKTVNGHAGEKLIDPAVYRTVQPNYTAAPIIADTVRDPVRGAREGVIIGRTTTVTLAMPTEDWDQHAREVARAEYAELVEYGLRPAYVAPMRSDEAYLDHLERIGDDKDGFHQPMQRAIWHWATSHPPELDAAFKEVLRQIVRDAVCTEDRDLDQYLIDQRLNASLQGARDKAGYQARGLHRPFLIRS